MSQTVHIRPLYRGSGFTPCGQPLAAVEATHEVNEATCDKCLLLNDAYCNMMEAKERAA